MVIANGYEQKSTTTPIKDIIIAKATPTKTIKSDSEITTTTTTIRMMTTAIATVENELLAAVATTTNSTTSSSTTTTTTTSSDNKILNSNLNETSTNLVSKISDFNDMSENDSPEKLEELSEICDNTDKIATFKDENSEMKEQFNNVNVNLNNNNNNNIVVVDVKSDENNYFEIDSNTLQNNHTNKIPTTTPNDLVLSNNWCKEAEEEATTTTTEQDLNSTQQSTENFLSGLGVDISSFNKNLNLPQTTASKFYALNDDLSTNSKTSTTVTLTNSVIGMSIKGNTILPNTTTFDLSNNAVVTENGQAKIILICESNSHPFQARTIMLTPNIECKVGRLIAKSKASETNAIFDCKVLSRNHAVLWYTPEDQKFWVKDTKSSNGTFINDQKLGNEAAELHFGDVVKFGVDVVENSRKEVHGCIIASVKLYLPDGREAMSSDALHNGRSAYSGEKCITYDELHRLNLYVQEVSNREKNLKSKLFNIQNLLDATRKNSGLCWQALIAEDQLLHRIHMLEKKLQVMEKNVPESSLRNEVIKLLEDRNAYQQQAKETLKKVYQERCDALHLHAKVEAAYAQSENECKILREQVMTGKQSLQEVSNRLLQLETEYIEYKEEVQRQQQEEKEEETARSLALTKLLRDRELECEELKCKITQLMLKAANKVQEEEAHLDELEAVEKIDEVIADMDLDEDDEDDDDEDDDDEQDHVVDELDKISYNDLNEFKNKSTTYNGVDVVQLNNSKNERKLAENDKKIKDSPMMKWLQNSDLNKKEGSSDIFKAMCNESDSSDEADSELLPPVKKSKSLQSAYNSLLELEKNIIHEIETDDDQKIIEHVTVNVKPAFDGTKHFDLLRQSVTMLRDVYNDIIIAQEQTQENKVKLEPQLTLKEEVVVVEEEVEDKATITIHKHEEEIALLKEKLKNYEMEWESNMELMHAESDSYKQKVFELMSQVELLREEKQALEQNQQIVETSDLKVGDYESQTTPMSSTSTTPTRSTLTGTPAHHLEEQSYQDDDHLSDLLLMNNSAAEREEELIMYKENLEQSRVVNSELRREINELKTKLDKRLLVGVGPGSMCTNTMLLRYILPYGVAAVAVLCLLSTYY